MWQTWVFLPFFVASITKDFYFHGLIAHVSKLVSQWIYYHNSYIDKACFLHENERNCFYNVDIDRASFTHGHTKYEFSNLQKLELIAIFLQETCSCSTVNSLPVNIFIPPLILGFLLSKIF